MTTDRQHILNIVHYYDKASVLVQTLLSLQGLYNALPDGSAEVKLMYEEGMQKLINEVAEINRVLLRDINFLGGMNLTVQANVQDSGNGTTEA